MKVFFHEIVGEKQWSLFNKEMNTPPELGSIKHYLEIPTRGPFEVISREMTLRCGMFIGIVKVVEVDRSIKND